MELSAIQHACIVGLIFFFILAFVICSWFMKISRGYEAPVTITRACGLPNCHRMTDHPGGYCCKEHHDKHKRMLREARGKR